MLDALGLGRLDELRSDDQDLAAADRATAAVRAFIDAVGRLSALLDAELGGPLHAERLSWLLRDVRQSGRDRRGVIAPGVHYAVHGAGCRFTLLDGAELDVDLDAERSAVVFDAWRVRCCAESIGNAMTRDDEPALRAALCDADDVAAVRDGWFAIR